MLFLATIMVLCLCGCDSEKTTVAVDPFDSDGDGVLSETEQRQLYYDAVTKNSFMPYLKYDASASETVVYSDHQTENVKSVQVKMIDVATDDARYSASYSEGDKSFDCFYSNEYVYSNESGEMYKAPMTESEFVNQMARQIVLTIGDEFTQITASKNEDGTYDISLSGMDNIPRALAEHFYESGATELSLINVSGKALVSDSGFLMDNSITFELGMNLNGEAVTVKYSAEINYQNLGQKFTITLPDEETCTEVEDIRAPLLIKSAYSNIYGQSYNASYESLYDYDGGRDEYSMDLDYSLSVSESAEGFVASDETVIDYDTVSSGRTVKRSSQYENGVQISKSKKSKSENEMSDDSARDHYYQMLLDYEPDLKVINNISIEDLGNYYELEYKYTEESAILYCQNVLTALIEDQEGIAVHSEVYTIDNAVGTMRIDKASGKLITHKIEIAAIFNDDGESFTVGFEHMLKVYDTAVLEVENVEAKAGDIIEVDVYIDNNPGVAAIDVQLDFDTDVFTAVSVETTRDLLFKGTFTTRKNYDIVIPRGVWLGTDDYYENGKIMTFAFEVNENAPVGEYIISLLGFEGCLANEDAEILEVTCLHGTVTIS